jgi:branched-chain amino acid aminotransferase
METVVWHDGRWHEDANPPLMGGLDQAFWMSTVVFDGARAFDGWAPDLDLHCERLLRSARSLLMNPPVEAAFVERLCREAIRKFEPGAHLYVRPMIWARDGFILPEADSAAFALAVLRAPVAEFSGMSVCLSSLRRPGPRPTPRPPASIPTRSARSRKRRRAASTAACCSIPGTTWRSSPPPTSGSPGTASP